jgi:hypothetical protein
MDFMSDVNNKNIPKKRGRGRPRKEDAATTLVPVQLSKATVKNLDRWAKDNAIGSRSGAIRALVEAGLATAAPRKPKAGK